MPTWANAAPSFERVHYIVDHFVTGGIFRWAPWTGIRKDARNFIMSAPENPREAV